MTTSVRQNIAANYVGRIVVVGVGIAFVPIYLRLLGPTAYGLVAFFTTVQSIMGLFDLGLGTTLQRQLAVYAVDNADAETVRDFTRTLEAVYWVLSLIIALSWVLSSGAIASHWLKSPGGASPTYSAETALLGVTAALQLPFAFYSGGLLGLQRHIVYNGFSVAFSIIRAFGALGVLVFVSPTVLAFFVWQATVSLVQSGVTGLTVWHCLPSGNRPPRFQWYHLERVWRFAIGAGGTTAVGALRSQIDRIVLSRMLSLGQFGYYAVAATLGATVYFMATPFFMAYLPRFAEVAATDDDKQLANVYHEANQLMSAVLMPAAAVASLFAAEILLIWTGDAALANGSSAIAVAIILGYLFVAINGIYYTLQLALGWTRLAFVASLGTLAFSIPIVIIAAHQWGALGAAIGWGISNAVYACWLVVGTHRRVLRGEFSRWVVHDLGFPLVASVVSAGLFRAVMPHNLNRQMLGLYIAATAVTTLIASVASTPVRRQVRAFLSLPRISPRE